MFSERMQIIETQPILDGIGNFKIEMLEKSSTESNG